MVDVGVTQGAARHARVQRLGGVLDHGHAAAALDCPQSRGAVRKRARQHHANDAAAEGGRSRPEKGVDRRTRQVLARTAPQQHVAVVQQKMKTGHGDMDPAAFETLAGYRGHRQQRAGLGQDIGEIAVGTDMQHDEHGSRQAGLEAANQCSERFQGADRTADCDDVTGGGCRVCQCHLQPVLPG